VPSVGADRGASIDLIAVDVLPILMVDDRPENLRALEGVLEPLGYPLMAASSGAEALRLLLEHDFALILLDVRMPELDGLETARLIKGRARTQDIPIVFLTAARDEVGDILRGYGVGAVDYVLKPFDPELLRSKVAVFAELERSRRALKRSEAVLEAVFEAAPIGRTVLDGEHRIVRSNPAFARLVGREPADLPGVPVADLCHLDDREALSAALDAATREHPVPDSFEQQGVDLRLTTDMGAEVWVGLVASAIEPTELVQPLLLAQWVDLSARRRAEQARAELLMEHAARTQAEASADRLAKLQALSGTIDSLSLVEVLGTLVPALAELFGAEVADVRLDAAPDGPIAVRAAQGPAHVVEADEPDPPVGQWHEAPLVIEGERAGAVRLGLPAARVFTAAERSLLYDAGDRAALAIRRAQLHEQEHRIAVELQRGLLPKELPDIAGVTLAAHYEAAGVGAEVGGDWYDAFALPEGRVGVVVGDVAGRGIAAASAMGQLRSVTRAFALADDGRRAPAEVLTRLNRHQLALEQEELFTVVYAIIDPGGGSVAWASAGHPPPVLRAGNGETRFLDGGEGLMGFDEIVYSDLQAAIGGHSTVVFYTDGLIERRGESLEMGLRRLAGAVGAGPQEPEALCKHVLDNVLPAGADLHDDVTAVVARVD
jgi:PAS domain S-box-containing protein